MFRCTVFYKASSNIRLRRRRRRRRRRKGCSRIHQSALGLIRSRCLWGTPRKINLEVISDLEFDTLAVHGQDGIILWDGFPLVVVWEGVTGGLEAQHQHAIWPPLLVVKTVVLGKLNVETLPPRCLDGGRVPPTTPLQHGFLLLVHRVRNI